MVYASLVYLIGHEFCHHCWNGVPTRGIGWSGSLSDIYGTLEIENQPRIPGFDRIKTEGKPLKAGHMAEREGFEPSVQVLARTTV